MKKILVALLAVATVGWYAQGAQADPHRGYRSKGHHGHDYHRGHRGHHGKYHHGYRHHRPHYGWHHKYKPPCHGPYYRPYVRKYYVKPAPYSGVQLYGKHGGFSWYW
ncbi:MAG: hypothetical protein MI757_19180 [Pirellulales bacterium]|nr:hypothetical protein [Pirellulales bacterium]